MWISARSSAALLAVLAAACSSTSSEGAGSSGGTKGSGANGSGANGSGANGSNASGGSSGSSNPVTGFCVLGAQGCPCDATGSCAAGLSCKASTCCDGSDCSVPPGQGSTGTSSGGATATGGPGPGDPHDPGTAGTAPASVCTPGVVGPVITDCGYPYASDNPLTSIVFNESEVLRAIVPSGGSPIASVRLFYNDEHALTLGVRSVAVQSSSGTVTHDFPVSELTDNPGTIRSPLTGTNDLIGDDAGTDPVGRPMWPALFVTDTTANPDSRAGDWQMGGTAWNPSVVHGSWKAAIRSVDTTVTPNVSEVTPDADPAKNNWDLGSGGDPLPDSLSSSSTDMPPKMGMMGMTGPKNEGYGTEVRWDLVLVAGHSYRIQVMVHDGDQNKVGGDSGEACVNFCADSACPEYSEPCSDTSPCPIETESICVNGCCL